MRVLLALDGSVASDVASQAVEAIAWPAATTIEVVGVVEPLAQLTPPVVLTTPDDVSVDERAARELDGVLQAAVASISETGVAARRRLGVGRPATLIVELASELRAELVIVGSRGRGPLASMLLGSVSAEVVDRAPCPVLVVRAPLSERVLLAVDGSASAEAAVTYLTANRLLVDREFEVLSVAPSSGYPLAFSIAGPSETEPRAIDRRRAEYREWATSRAAAAETTLARAGYRVRSSISEGDAAQEIIEAAKALRCGLVVVGSRGLTGVNRILVGSVARNVLLHTGSSVLVVREPHRVRRTAPAAAGHSPALRAKPA
jgi:nucleotide-binding universal stress UspA family protein